MKGRRILVAAAGFVIVGLYLIGSAWSGHLSPFARRPLADGVSPPPPYRWVKPPPALAASNQPPLSGKATVTFSGGHSNPGVFRTDDSQAVMVLLSGSIQPEPGQESALLTLTPLAPSAVTAPAGGYTITGNVYRIVAAYQPGGKPVGALHTPAELVMIYPQASATIRHTLLYSPDGRKWRPLRTLDSPIQQQVSNEHVVALGYFAAATTGEAAPSGASGGGSVLVVALIGVALVVVLAVAFLEYRRRQAADVGRRGRGRGKR